MSENKISCLEVQGVEARENNLLKRENNYSEEIKYSANHIDAISNGDPRGKGTNSGSHSHSVPDCSLGNKGINYKNFDTHNFDNTGGEYDMEGYKGIGGRNFLMTISKYSKENEYGKNSIDISNTIKGQVRF